MLSGKKVLLGVTGGIAAYKAAYLVRHLIKRGAEVRVILTPAARDFVSPLTLATLSKNPVLWNYFEKDDAEGKWNNHVELGLWADLFIIAPGTSNTMAGMVQAKADNLLLGTYLSAKCPVFIAPAMDLDMYRHPANQKNMAYLKKIGNAIIPAESGQLASGLEGEGRMAEPENIVLFIENWYREKRKLKHKKVLINAGPTHENIDPVRFLGNRSSGKTGIALAEAAYQMGADVTLVLGPTHLAPTENNITVIRVQTAEEMLKACQEVYPRVHYAILSAAVADYRPATPAKQKIKKTNQELSLALEPTLDILKTLGQQKKEQILVGFALETENALANGKSKLHNKNCDVIVLNSPDDKERGFGHDTNEVTLLTKEQEPCNLPLKSKEALAHEILNFTIHNFSIKQ
jgi:phosphopantothenoylcysteine decarboxylase/phosphopantothenate--cysteine ligase